MQTVTTGMAATTREEIIRLCRQYMANPNAIIMCIQGTVVYTVVHVHAHDVMCIHVCAMGYNACKERDGLRKGFRM